MFGLKKKTVEKFFAPVSGSLITMDEVEDPVFSQKMMGDGLAVRPSSDEIASPVSGKVTTVFPTKHAFGITTDNGLEIIVHLGLDTVELQGEPFQTLVSEGQEVRAGEIISKMDREKIKDLGKIDTVVVVITNMDRVKAMNIDSPREVQIRDAIGEIEISK